ncbi:phospholipase D-like domain-containing protein [Anaeromyxobacter oryzae]|uniref:phospholipase D-like domain-containing protein n=1 Tax=Anaeromyxobacter oryzae TaxID=2918170 RepID=UPI0020BF931A|nr:phospholipase D-like domain-containing protein [Anaeromyxobacter oryzae]
MIRSFASGIAVGAALGTLARRWWDRRTRSGALGSLRMGLTEGLDQVGLALMQATGVSLVDANRLAWRDNGEVFDAMEEAIGAARHSIHFDVYIWKPGKAGTRLAELVCRRAREGLAVRVLVDPMGSTGFDEELSRPLRDAGCEVRYFRDPKKRPFTLTGRNHRKLVVVDGRVGFTGGFGIAPEWSGDGLSPDGWRDANAEVEGPVVRQMQAAFAAHWLETGGALLPRAEFERARPAGGARAAYVTSMDVVGLSHARWVTHIALMAARRRAWIANAYFVPPPELLGALLLLPRHGVDVRLLLPGPHQDHRTITFLQRRLYPRLERGGMSVYEYQPSMMHAKTMLVDDRLVVVGSINLDYLSMEWLEEGCLVVDDRTFAAELERRWHADLAHSRQVAGGRARSEPRAVGATTRPSPREREAPRPPGWVADRG